MTLSEEGTKAFWADNGSRIFRSGPALVIHFKGWSCLQGFCVDLSVGTAPEITGRRRHRTECHRYIEMQSNQMVWTIGLSVAQRNGHFHVALHPVIL